MPAFVTSALPLALAPTLGAALRVVDGVAFALLLVFALWGMRRGVLRQALSLVVLVGAILTASWLGPRVEATLAKVAGLAGVELQAAAWTAVLFAALVMGAVVLSFACCRLGERKGGGARWLAAGLLGGLQGALVLLVASYALVGTGASSSPPALARPTAPSPEKAQASPWIERLQGSLSADAMVRGADLVGRLVDVPAWIEQRRREVDQALEAGAPLERRPRERAP